MEILKVTQLIGCRCQNHQKCEHKYHYVKTCFFTLSVKWTLHLSRLNIKLISHLVKGEDVQRRLIDDLVELELHTEKISLSVQKTREILDRLLSAPDKSFEIIFCGELFDFDLPFTPEEHEQLAKKRKLLIDKLMIKSFVTNNWNDLLVFASGTDPLDMQCEIIKSQDLYNVTDSKGCPVKALALNEDADVVKFQRLKEDDVYQN